MSRPSFKIAVVLLAAALCLLVPTAAKPTKMEEDEIDLSYRGDRIYGHPDEKNGETLQFLTPENMTGNPEEMGNYAEGDILFVQSDLRNGVRAASKRWPNARVPYKLAGHFTEQDKRILAQAMDEYHAKTCIRFVPYAGDRNYIRLTSTNTGCWSSVGMVGGEQDVNFGQGCINQVGTPMHELMHALGFMHEQNREDRDGSVTINWDNVRSNTRENFAKANAGTTDAQGVPYDFDSVLHYSANAFSINGQPTIVSKRGAQPNMGQRRGFSKGDLLKLNRMYCNGDGPGAASPLASAAGSNGAAQPNFFQLLFNGFRQPKSPAADEQVA